MQLALSHLGYHPNSLKLVTLCPGADHAYLPERLPFCLRQNCFRMSLLLLLSLLACIAAPLCSGADEVMGATADITPSEAPKEKAATGKLTLLREVKNRAEMVHFVTYNPEPRFELWVPTELRAEYDAIPTETEKFAWLAEHFRVQFENGDILSGNDLGILHLYGLGVEKDWKKAQELFVEPIKKGRWVGPRYLAELLLKSPEQPQNARLAAELLIPMLKAKNRHAVWAAFEADNILQKSENPEDKALATQLVVLCAEMIEKQLKSPPSDDVERGVLSSRANRITDVLLNNDSEVNRRLAESLIAAWLLSEPRSVDAKIRSLVLRIVQKDLEKQWSEAGVLLAGGGLDDNTKSWVQGIRDSSGRTLSKMSAWEDMHKSDAPKPRVASRWLSGDLLPAPLAAAASVSVLLSLSLLTRFRRRYEVGIFLMLLWYFARLLFFNPLLAPSWVLAVYCPVAISILWVAVTGPKALPYFAEPKSRHGFAGKTWLEAVGLCVLLLVGSAAFDTAFPWFYHQLAGVDLAEQSIIPLLKSELPSQILAMVLSVGLFYPVIEEILYRGFLHDWLSRKLPLGVAVVLGSSIFGFVHGVDHAMQTAMFGIACVWLRLRYQSLIPSMLLHALSNTAALFLHNWRG